jgi:alanine dehydrogenase
MSQSAGSASVSSGEVAEQDAGGVHFVSSAAAGAVLSWPLAIDAIRAAYAQPRDAAATPHRTVARAGGAWLRTLPAVLPQSRYFGAKLMGMAAASASPGVNYVIVLYDRVTSRLVAFVDGCLVTAYRTAATSAVALDRLAPPGPASLGVIGSGLEASMHVRAFAAVRPLTDVAVYSPAQAHREALAESLTRDLGVRARGVRSVADAVESASVALAAARSRDEQPLLFGSDLRPGMTVVSIGSTVPEQREIDASVVGRCDLLVFDDPHEVIGETGAMLAAAEAQIPFADKSFSLTDLLCGAIDDRCAQAEIPMFKSVGGGLQDVAVAEVVFRTALAEGRTLRLPIAFDTKS